MRYTSLFMLAGLAACANDAIHTPTLRRGSAASLDCTDLGPPEPGCPVLWSTQEAPEEMATSAGTASGAETLWTGQLSSSIEAPLLCPNYVSVARNIVYIPATQETATFVVSSLTKVANLGTTGQGWPIASYAVPNSPIYSTWPAAKYVMQGGQMKGRCAVIQVRTPYGFRVELGPITWFDYTGSIWMAEEGGSGGGGGERGWGYYASDTQTTTGAGSLPEGAQQAVDQYLSGGGCTIGWEIWVDGAQACDAEGNEYDV